MYPVMRGYCVIQFLWDSSPWCFICSSRIHMGDDMSKILNYFDIWLVTCLRFWIFSTYGGWHVEDSEFFRHMGDDVSKILDFFDIWQAFCSRNLPLLDVPAAVFDGCGGWFLCLQTAVFSGYFFLKICALWITLWKKKRFYRLFLRFCLHLWVFAVTLRQVMRYIYLCGGPTFG